MAIMDTTAICLDTGPLIAYLKGREPGATAVAHGVCAIMKIGGSFENEPRAGGEHSA